MKRLQYNEKKFSDFREIITNSSQKYGNLNAFHLKNPDGSYYHITYRQLESMYYSLCGRFLEMGLKGKKIAVMGPNSFQWILCYMCAATVGVAVPIDKELSPSDVKNLTDISDCRLFCGEDKIAAAFAEVSDSHIEIIPFSQIKVTTSDIRDSDRFLVDSIEIKKDEMQVLLFTSGTTGSAKGVCLSQYNICTNVHQTVSIVKILPTDKTLSVLPVHHTYECTLDHILMLSRGACISYCESIARFQRNLKEFSPTLLVVVPALLKVLDKKVRNGVLEGVPPKYKYLFEELPFAEAMKKIPFFIRTVIKNKVRKTLGGKLKLFIVGAAALEPELVENFCSLGIRTLQGYGLTECSPLLAGNNDFYLNPKSAGVAVPGVELRIDQPDDEGVGEILAKGENIMLGYFNDPEATEKTFKEGWFCTGDLGYLDDEGGLYITGRKKNVIVTPNGKNIYPEELETRLSAYEQIGEVIVMEGAKNGEPCVKARIYPNEAAIEAVLGYAPSLFEVKQAVHNAVNEMNAQIPQFKHIKVIEILQEPLEKTTTQKIKRYGENTK